MVDPNDRNAHPFNPPPDKAMSVKRKEDNLISKTRGEFMHRIELRSEDKWLEDEQAEVWDKLS